MTLKKPPSVVQLPGGVRLNAVPFKVVEYAKNESPLRFEILPRDVDVDQVKEFVFWLYAHEDSVRGFVPKDKR